MTSDTVMDKQRLAAFADGALEPEDAAAVVMHLADHPGDQRYVDEIMAANAALGAAFEAPLNEPVPPSIRDAIMGPAERGADVIPFRRRPALWAGGGLALAASAVLSVMLLPQLAQDPNTPGDRLALGPVLPGSALAERLETLSSGIPEALSPGRELMILASVPVADGFCRELEVIDDAEARVDLGIACREEGGWRMTVVVSEPLVAPEDTTGFAAASGDAAEWLTPYLERLGAGAPLDPEAEAAAISAGWGR